jgi:LysR family glycine cleavage system transcriptional activator
MVDRLPPFKSIEAFVVAARTLSFTKAASALHITVPAISRRIQALEAELGTPLFQRMNRALKLTRSGELYLQKLAPAIESIREASAGIRYSPRRNAVKVSVVPSFAAHWLIPRLPRFYAEHRAIQVEFDTSMDYVDFDDSDVDVAIRFGSANWSGLQTKRLFDVMAYPVCSHEFVQRLRPPFALNDLVRVPLLGSSHQPELWPGWLRMAGIPRPSEIQVINFDTLHLLYEAAVSGLGVAMGFDAIVRPYVDDGRLTAPFETKFVFPKKFYLVCPTHDHERLPVHIFCRWLMAEAAAWRNERAAAAVTSL